MGISTKFADQGTSVGVMSFDENAISDSLKPAVYSIGQSMFGFYLNKVSARMSTPETLYGSVETRVNKILNSYKDSKSSFGVLLSGAKGSGKTMCSSIVANRAIDELKIPVILVEDTFDPSALAGFIPKLGECVLFFDEFGKRYKDSADHQGELLSLFDGTGSSKRLVLLTENNRSDINRYMLNRPGRIWYHFEYDKLEESIVEEYCKSAGVEQTVVDKIKLRREIAREFSFDVLQALVTEYKRYGGDINHLADDLNIEKIYEPSRPKMVVVEVIEQDTGKSLEFYEMAEDFPDGVRGYASVKIKSELTDAALENAEDDDDKDFILTCNAKSIRFGMKNLISKDNDIYVFRAEDNNKPYIIRVLKDSKSGGYAGY